MSHTNVILAHFALWIPLLGVLAPLAVAYFTKESTSGGIKGLAMVILAGCIGALANGLKQWSDGVSVNWEAILVTAVTAAIVGQVAHTSLFKHAVAPKLQAAGPITDNPAAGKHSDAKAA